MKQLSGMDAVFLYMESEATPMHVAGLTLYDPPEGFTGSFHTHFTEFFKGRLHLIPIFNKKLARTVMQLDHPGWVDVDDVDLDYHIQSLHLPKPGTFQQLQEAVAKLHENRLDRKKPLWQFTIIEGLEDGRYAMYSKVHHAAIDGGAGMVITQALYDLGPVPRQVEPPKPKVTKRKPTVGERAVLGMHDMATNVVRQQLRFAEAVPKTMAQMADLAVAAMKRPGSVGLVSLLAPKTPFNSTITKERSFAARSISLMDVKMISKATGAKVNDIVMAISGGALRAYLDGKRKLPDAPLVAFVPISLREAGNTDLNNQVFGMNCALATNYGDPLKRLSVIQRESGQTKDVAGSVKDIAPQDYTMVGAPLVLPGLMELYGQARLADVMPHVVNLTISNTAGPPFPMYCAGAKVAALYPVSIPVHGVGLNITVQSYRDKMDFGITAGTAALPDVDHFADLLVASFEELKAAALPAVEETKTPPSAVENPAKSPAESQAKAPAKENAKPAATKPATTKPRAKTSAKATKAPKTDESANGAVKTTISRRASSKPKTAPKTSTKTRAKVSVKAKTPPTQ
ncbi:MAG: wax ester/triacylglycerol synthase family O-acyltransferase [Pseudomonadota bacterium]